ncbi:uncharacterized protein LOC124933071 [Impatiens glandulifera]|uniref:uncharacterized protein LOC124933071 n=1 Tax=Impatiens glandulifera TaxID=253017 RepID=UPI001FB0597A|nr:uncharacterized protein LOC124933071 [Impatiens glandulifera]
MVLTRTSIISNTKKFFKRKLKSFKIFISGGYQRLPKTYHFNPFSCGCNSSNTNNDINPLFYSDFDMQNKDNDKANEAKREDDQRKEMIPSNINNRPKKGLSCSRSVRERRACMVGNKLIRELEIVEKRSSVEHRLDVEEVLHYYSRLTCPTYRDIVDQFLINLYEDISDEQNPSSG